MHGAEAASRLAGAAYAPGVDASLAVASKRYQRPYAERLVQQGAVSRILAAGGIAGSAKNRRPWRLLVLGHRGLVEQVAQTVHAPSGLEADERV
jgi:nitroreductase